MAAAPAHYIRTIHTTFTAAHPRNSPSAWASAAAASPRYTPGPLPHSPSQKEKDMHLHTQQAQFNEYQLRQHQPQQQYAPPAISINTHNQHTYTHHLYALHGGYPAYSAAAPQGQGYTQGLRKGPAGAAAAGGRRRSVSIRVPPTYGPHRGRAPAYKFDPFADEEAAPPSAASPLTSGSQANRAASAPEAPLQTHAAPYTIHIPAAQPTEIQQYTPPTSPRPAARTASLRSLVPINGPLPGTAPTATAVPVRSPAPKQAQQPPNLSKIVAGILLNRVHAVGKPMRRRVSPHLNGEGEKGYRKSCLSSVVSVEA